MPRAPGKLTNVWAQAALYASLGFILPGAAVGGLAIGWLLDKWLRTSPVLTLVMTGLGAAGGIIELLRILQRAEKRGNADSSND
jgi:F0F1-type ATP synthase assembly protein I